MAHQHFEMQKYNRDAVGGIMQYEWRSRAWAAPAALDVDYLIDEFEPTADGDWHDISDNLLNGGLPDVYRNVKVTVVDANSSISVWVKVIGEDQFGDPTTEILRVSAGEGNVFGKVAWSYISAVEYKCTGTVTVGADTVAVGIGTTFGLPVNIGDESDYGDVRIAVVDSQNTPEDAFALGVCEVNAEFDTITFPYEEGDREAGAGQWVNGSTYFAVECYATCPEHTGIKPVRPRGYAVITTN